MQKEMVFLAWERDGVRNNVTFPLTESYIHKDLILTPSFTNLKHGRLITLTLTPNVPFHLTQMAIRFPLEIDPDDRMMINGYQTWTESREFKLMEQIPPLRLLAKPVLGPYGDYTIRRTPGKTGRFQSWTYTYFRRRTQPFLLTGSVDESFAYTLFECDWHKKVFSAEKELVNLQVTREVVPLKLFIAEGKEEDLWGEYDALLPHYRQKLKKCTGWTSWYNYYTDISQQIIQENLQALQMAEIPLDVFQIDDGYQETVGDWLKPNGKFPSGMKAVANEIKAAGYRPGIWLAPFVCEKKSFIYREHPEWLLRNARGVPVKAGWNPGWSGWFYALDIYSPGLREYLSKVFETVFAEWGYEMVKLDFLYAAALQPRKDRSRGRIMVDAMEFIRELVGDKWVLGCGVPLGPAFGQVDYCRIGSDVAPYWEDSKLAFLRYRERVSTLNSLSSTIGRWQLNNRVFLNDPDVFILRDTGNKLTSEQKNTLFFLNYLLGGLIFFSDNVSEYSKEQLNTLKSLYPVVEPTIDSVEELEQPFCYRIKASIGEYAYCIYTSLSEHPYSFLVKESRFAGDRGFVAPGTVIQLKPYETLCLYQVRESREEPYFLGTTGHIFPGVPVESFTVDGDQIEIKLKEGISPETKVYVGVPNHCIYVKINGRQYSAKLNSTGVRYISIALVDLQ